MRSMLAILCLCACGTSAMAQYGVSTQRDAYGNLVRDTGPNQPKAVNQGPVNQGPVNNGRINTAPAQPTTGDTRMGNRPNR